ncbi:MAG: nucleotide sugar dehydrogenase [Candidatus Aenigmarchaeota archaeon]|nr:nucleotide sugar dehydrogenase [Candidatus Aenigmarchaeota archaeon]MBS3054168.1 nucleotide sugar dehydrogenase [Candidatus Aenigmarchaeota archaeon]
MKIFSLDEEQIMEQTKTGKTVVAVIGFGYVGASIGSLLARNNKVIAIDVNPAIINAVNNGKSPINEPEVEGLISDALKKGNIRATAQISEVADADVILVTVGTPLGKNYEPNLEYINEVSEKLGSLVGKGAMIILKSTVTPGTTEELVKIMLEKKSNLKAGKDFGLAFCPERLAEGSAIQDLKKLPIIIGGIDAESGKKAESFWRSNGFVTTKVSSAKAAEMAKLADNLWIDANIALANELAMLCERMGLDASEVIDAANSLPKGRSMVNILYPGCGVGGSCLTKDPWFVYHLGKKAGLNLKTPKTSREVNEAMPAHTVDLVKSCLAYANKKIKGSRIAVLGLAFKGGTGDVRNTPMKEIVKLLEAENCIVTAYDPWVTENDARMIAGNVAKTPESAIENADCILIGADHPQFKSLDLKKLHGIAAEGCSIVEGRIIFGPVKAAENGFGYAGIGKPQGGRIHG